MWKAMDKLSPRSKASSTSSSRMFVSLNVTATMRSSGLSPQTTREIIRVSIGSLLILGVAFIVIYTVLLAYVDNKFQLLPYDDKSWHLKKVRLVGKKFNSEPSSDFVWQYQVNSKRKALWNVTGFYGDAVLPRCEPKSLFRIVITSAPKNKLRRQAIRETWCKPENFKESANSWQCVFLISHSDDDKVNSLVKQEIQTHNDILLGNYVDSYRNLTFKVIHGIYWFVKYCPSSYIIKTDDDCFVNSGLIFNFLLNDITVETNLYAGKFVMEQDKLMVVHGKDSKWSVAYEEYPYDYYPPYASGIGYILSLDSAKKFIDEVNFIKPIANEDAFVGIVMSRINIQPTTSSRFVLSPSGLNICNFLFIMIAHDVQSGKQSELMKTVVKSRTFCKGVETDHTWS